jgi:hypothetical protein
MVTGWTCGLCDSKNVGGSQCKRCSAHRGLAYDAKRGVMKDAQTGDILEWKPITRALVESQEATNEVIAKLQAKLRIAEETFNEIKREVGTSTRAWHLSENALAELRKA